jgi:hypothetical protein
MGDTGMGDTGMGDIGKGDIGKTDADVVDISKEDNRVVWSGRDIRVGLLRE